MDEGNHPRVSVFGLASCFGCQLQITNREDHLMEVLGQFDLGYWQMTSSAPKPRDYDVAIIEGAVTTRESADLVREIRDTASVVIAIGSCATTGGVPGMAAAGLERMEREVYPEGVPAASGHPVDPRPVADLIDVDYEVRCCPIDFWEFTEVLEAALKGSNHYPLTRTMCGDCKANETRCFYDRGQVCLGLVTMAGCHARCVNLGRPCNGCRGISPDASLEGARHVVAGYGLDVGEFDEALAMFNQANPAYREYLAAHREG